ncbi:IucA/IucC family siderophore biosynthesis protein [Kribbella albertanoniae]|uniref:IucA/IucC family siderophore biosynthesis protein n=1 Tax=Kribbella albertanoniae TaxID=1266829 RepID=A0A4R4PJ32_9ACTN|nr:IucA/IucC family siderophore biosynthesis protein [Kribbella albertanoniae]
MTLRVLSTLIREDVLGLRTGSTLVERADGLWLELNQIAVPVGEDNFQAEYGARRPLLEVDGTEVTGLDDILAVLRDLADAEDRGGYDTFADECRQTLATMELHDEVQAEVLAGLAQRYGDDPADWTGLGGSLAFDTLAAFLDHPVYPTARGRLGLTAQQVRAYTPEFHPTFQLRWVAVPGLAKAAWPEWWPTTADIGLPELTDHTTLPIHPLTEVVDGVLGPIPYLDVVPTLSTRTVAVVQDPRFHLKLPIATATLGARNRRTIKAGVLVDGAAGERLMHEIIAREPRFRTTILNADEQTYYESGHELFAVLLRRFPDDLDDALVVPLAAFAAQAPSGRRVVDHLADRFYDGKVPDLYDAFVTLLLDWQTTLFGYGIAVESHQQNTSVIFDRVDGNTRIRLLYKDNDGPRINVTRWTDRGDFTDARVFGEDDRALTDLFTTITVHLCTASLAFALPEHDLLGILRTRLTEAVGRLCADGAALRADLLDADRLPVKAMVTAGTLLSKQRSGAADINKHYTTGPNYLRLAL